jgi:hypothetical protein
MTLARLPLLLVFSALSTCAVAGGNVSSSQTTSSNADVGTQHAAPLLGGAESLPTDPDVAPPSRLPSPETGPQNLVFEPNAQDRVPLARFRKRPGRSLADVNGDVCYTMRTYKVKPTERIRDRENLFQGYSECEMASSFQIRSAEAHEKKPRPDGPPATLK